MLVFIDESGDPGFDVEAGATPLFAAAMVIFADGDAARRTDAVIRATAKRLKPKPEFKFNKNNNEMRDAFFNAVRGCPFTVRAIVVRKEVIYSKALKADTDRFYRFFVRQMMTHDAGLLDNARVIIDGSGDKRFRAAMRKYLRSQLGERVESVKFADSVSDPLIQLADMCVGAIARSFRHDRKEPSRWRRILEPRIGNIWNFQ